MKSQAIVSQGLVLEVRDYLDWRDVCKRLLAMQCSPERVALKATQATPLLIDDRDAIQSIVPRNGLRVSNRFITLSEAVACHRDESRWDNLYQALWRQVHGERELMKLSTDELVYRLLTMERQVTRDCHKMKAFVRFQKVEFEEPSGGIESEYYVAWHKPDHHILRRTSPFFADRFRGMNWSIFTPEASSHWNGTELTYGVGATQEQITKHDKLEELWKTYYGATFNPARIKIDAMKREMPVRHWQTLPETQMIDSLLEEAPKRVEEMIAKQEGLACSAADYLPDSKSLSALRKAAHSCRGCSLYLNATQTVFGEGDQKSKLLILGEQPGDEEDRQGHPFVGPAGRLLDKILDDASIPRDALYVTNAVKHFSFEMQGKRRLHKKPTWRQIAACRPWVEQEIKAVEPRVVVCLGVTALQSLLGRQQRLGDIRGKAIPTEGTYSILATWHPAAILRAPPAQVESRREELKQDLINAYRLSI